VSDIRMILNAEYFDDLLCRVWERTRFPRSDPKHISVTEVTQCLLYSYMARVEPRCVPQVVSLLLGVQGHRIMAEALEFHGWLVEKLVCVERDGVKLCGRVDAYHPDLDVVAEFKFVNTVPEEPYEDHVKQIRIYMAMLGARHGIIVYFSRDPRNRTKVFFVAPRRRALDEAIERAKTLSRALEEMKPPRPEPGRWCRFCPYAFECHQIRGKNRKKTARLPVQR